VFSSIDVESGRVRWSKPLPNLTYNGPLSINGLVFLGETNPGMFRAYDAANGNILWQVSPADTVLGRFDLRDRFSQIVSAIQLTSMHLWHRLRHAADFGFEDIHAPPITYRNERPRICRHYRRRIRACAEAGRKHGIRVCLAIAGSHYPAPTSATPEPPGRS
jgi:hypothetical protein